MGDPRSISQGVMNSELADSFWIWDVSTRSCKCQSDAEISEGPQGTANVCYIKCEFIDDFQQPFSKLIPLVLSHAAESYRAEKSQS